MRRSSGEQSGRLSNSEILSDIESQLSYLPLNQRADKVNLVCAYPSLFGDMLSRMNIVHHDIDAGSVAAIKQHAYCCPVSEREIMKKEAEYLRGW